MGGQDAFLAFLFDCHETPSEGVIGRIGPTPGSVLIDKTKYDITIVCTKAGFQQATYINKSSAAGTTFGNIILGGGVGWAIDSATG